MQNSKMIYWDNGLFLKPHHFQDMSLYFQDRVNEKQNDAFSWGSYDLQIDATELLNNQLVLKSGKFLFKDGTIVDCNENAILTNTSLVDVLTEKSELKLYIGLKKLNKFKTNTTIMSQKINLNDVDTRYIVNKQDAKSVNNLYQDDDKVDIDYMDYVLKIFNDTNIQNSANYNILPLANIIKKDGKVVIDDSYIPPVLNIKANKKIDTIVSDLYSYLLSYVSQFESYKTSVELQNGLMTVSKQILALNTMAEYTAILDSYIYLDSPHPFEVYNTFAKMISRLSIFSTRVNVMGMTPSGEKLFKRYEHDNLEVSFNSASKLIKQLLDDITVGPEEVIAFKKDTDYYHLDIPSQYFKSDKYDFYISVYSTKVEDLEEQIEFAKISSYDDIDNIVERSLSGLTFDIKDTAPIGMQKENDKFYVELDTSNQIWQTIKAKQNIAIYLDEEDSMKLELIIMSKQ